MDEFLHSKSMLTPGVAGALTLTITGTLASNFGLPGNWTGLVTSFLLGALVWGDKRLASRFQQLLLYLMNSIVIFAVAMGLNSAGVAATATTKTPDYVERSAPPAGQAPPATPFFHSWFEE